MRLQRTIGSGWQFIREVGGPDRLDPASPITPIGEWRDVAVPGFWQVQFPELARATGAGWYRVRFDLDSQVVGSDRIALRFGAVAYYCQGWLNGEFIGDHEGGHLGFEWAVTSAARAGANDLLIRVVSPSGDRHRYPDFPFEETLHGKQNWYGPTGGIWQPVKVVANSFAWVESLDVRTHPADSTIEVQARIVNSDDHVGADDLVVVATVVDPDGRQVAMSELDGPAYSTTIALDEVRWWSLESPDLYTLTVQLRDSDQTLDRVSTTCGFRTFTAVDGGFQLNGESITLAGVLDQDYHDCPGVPTSKTQVLDRFRAIKAMGFNTLRCHIKVPAPMYLDAADEVGLLVWCEPPTTSRLTDRARQRIEDTLFGMIARDRHHPSVVIWGIANEAWGYDLVGSADDRAWLNSLYHGVKSVVDDRLIIDNSPCSPNFHIETDVEDYHFYAVIPELRERWDDFLDLFVGREAPTFSPHADARRTGLEPLVVSEFGAWGLADYECDDGREPWWFESGQEWADGAAYVHGAPQRAALWHIDDVFGSWAELCVQTQERQFDTAQYQIETMRTRPEIAGYVLTELGDVHWESNGLFDMWGRPRSFADRLTPLNQPATVIGILDRPCAWEDDDAVFDVTVINDGVDRTGVRVECVASNNSGDSVVFDLGSLAPYERGSFQHSVSGARTGTPQMVNVGAVFGDSSGSIAKTSKELLVIPRIGPQVDERQTLWVPDPGLADSLRTLGYSVGDSDGGSTPGISGAPVLRVLRTISDADRHYIERGGAALLLAGDVGALGGGFGEFPPVELKAWDDALFLGGSWVSAFSWLRRSGRFAELPGGPLMDAAFENLLPNLVIAGIPPARYEYDVLAGVFVGWVHQVAALIARNPVGLGSLLISTLSLGDASMVEDPLPNWMIHQLIATALE